jgi:hypothetical protein
VKKKMAFRLTSLKHHWLKPLKLKNGWKNYAAATLN